MKYILLLEPKTIEAESLAAQITAAGDYTVTQVRTMREACAALAERPHDLALLPVTRNDSLVYSLRVLQPGLPLFLLTPTADAFVPERQMQVVQGTVPRPLVIHALPDLLTGHWTAQHTAEATRHLNHERLQALMGQLLADDQIRLVVVQDGEEEMVFQHTASADQAWAAAARLGAMPPHGQGYQITFLNRTNGPENLLLLARPFGLNKRLILGAELHSGLGHLRQLANQLVIQLANPTADIPLPRVTPNQFALVWRGRQPVAEGLLTILRNVLSKIAQLYGCTVHHLEVEPAYVHLVLTAPAHRSSAWVAETFKRQSEMLLARTLHITLPLWAEGYLAQESAAPLGTAELKLFLQ